MATSGSAYQHQHQSTVFDKHLSDNRYPIDSTKYIPNIDQQISTAFPVQQRDIMSAPGDSKKPSGGSKAKEIFNKVGNRIEAVVSPGKQKKLEAEKAAKEAAERKAKSKAEDDKVKLDMEAFCKMRDAGKTFVDPRKAPQPPGKGNSGGAGPSKS
ncbi:hypothetical protein LTR37_011619 [Vermiconidia calcicola]|uniref:Uncharacterized protein n=1 Tax=Vermiconidia calcicola TaxID=1690605 RepID=A0ACC3N2M3_9PEZI|nr:hypothetical protein LTR37_011619 [Vermiconidia calcicola]